MSTGAAKFTKSWRSSLSDYGTALCWSPNGECLAAASAAGEVILCRPPADPVLLHQANGQSIHVLGFSPQGDYLAAAGQAGELLVWDLQSGTPGLLFTQTHPGIWIDQLAWHPTQDWLACAVGSQIRIWQVSPNQVLADLDFANSSVLHLAWQPAGELLAASGHGGLKVWAATDWAAAPKLIAVPGASLHCAWSADGRYLGSGNLDRTLTVAQWDSPPPWLMQGFPGKVRQVDWSPLNTRSGAPLIAAACLDGITVWERENRSGGGWQSRVLQHHRERVNEIAFQPNSWLLAAAGEDGIVTLWDQGKTRSQTLKFPQGGCAALAWHPNGESLAAVGTTGELLIWQLAQRIKGFG